MNRNDYTFREGGERDYESIEGLFRRHDYGPNNAEGWTRWKYLGNPDGPARVFVAEDPRKTIVGVLAYLPRRFTSAETGTFTVMRVVDIFVEAELRKQGVFLPLLELARSRMDVPKIGVPNDASIAFASGPGWHDLAPHQSWKFPVLVGGLIAGKSVAPVANAFSRIYESLWLPGRPRDLEMRPIARFERDYVLAPSLIHGVRSAEYLNWRFVDNPVRMYSTHEFFEGDEAIGYCAYAHGSSSAVLSDFVTRRHPRNCLRLFVDHCRDSQLTHVAFSGVGLRLKKLGFVMHGLDGSCKAFKVPKGRWMVTPCDTDSEG